MKTKMSPIKYILLAALCFLWAFPLLWAVVTAFRPSNLATGFSLTPSFTLDNIREVFGAAPFVKYGLNTVIIVFGILGVQLITVTLGAYALARVDFAGKGLAMALIMMQIIIPADILILPNYQTLKAVNLIDSRLGVMVPYFASSMGLLLLRQAFKSVPSAIVDAARMDGATVLQTLRYIFIPCSKAAGPFRQSQRFRPHVGSGDFGHSAGHVPAVRHVLHFPEAVRVQFCDVRH